MRNPLIKRLPRELRHDAGKYMVIFLLLLGMIGMVSGYLVADGSMLKAYFGSFKKYNIEDGNFTVQKKLNKSQIKDIEALDVQLYPLYNIDQPFDNGSDIRVFKKRDSVNLECLIKGDFPASDDEIAIDRMYADNNKINVGDTLTEDGNTWKITGFIALSDYSTLFRDNGDTMFDASKFGVAVVTEEGFDRLNADLMTYRYSWKYDTTPKTEKEENDISEDLMDDISDIVSLESFIPRYQNQAINFAGDDFSSDMAMITVLLYILIVIIAFVFAVTITNTIQKEANVIGTLLATGYTKGELVVHYMTLPLIVTVIASILGNIMGYTFFKYLMASLYYHSYSLPTYVTVWNGEAFVKTTVIPFVIMMVVNFFVLNRQLSLKPLQFLRRDLSRRKKKRALHLSSKLPFLFRFRTRVIFQNITNYLVAFIGILFANLLLLFGLGLPDLLDNYQNEIKENVLAKYQYILDAPLSMLNDDDKLQSSISGMVYMSNVETENEDAEKFSIYTLKRPGDKTAKEEEIQLYGISGDSDYVPLGRTEKKEVYISASYAEKYKLDKGDTINLKEIYKSDKYSFKVAGVYNYSGAVCVFMNIDDLNETFDLGNGYFCGYFSDTPIEDIDDKYISTVIDLEALTKVSRQLTISMGGMANMINIMASILFIILIYLLSKIIIEKNAVSISMTKILGYSGGEIAGLYILSSSVVMVASIIITIPLEFIILKPVFETVMKQEMAGWIRFIISPKVPVYMFLIGFVSYMVVVVLEYMKIRKVPMDEALKNVE